MTDINRMAGLIDRVVRHTPDISSTQVKRLIKNGTEMLNRTYRSPELAQLARTIGPNKAVVNGVDRDNRQYEIRLLSPQQYSARVMMPENPNSSGVRRIEWWTSTPGDPGQWKPQRMAEQHTESSVQQPNSEQRKGQMRLVNSNDQGVQFFLGALINGQLKQVVRHQTPLFGATDNSNFRLQSGVWNPRTRKFEGVELSWPFQKEDQAEESVWQWDGPQMQSQRN